MTSVTGRLGDLGLSQALLGSAQNTGASLQSLQARITMGQSALSYSELQGDTERYIASQNELGQVKEFARSTKTIGRYLTAADSALGSLYEIATNARALLVRALGLDSPNVDEYQLNEQARGLLDQAVAALNTKSEGTYIFAGTASDRPPVGYGALTRVTFGPAQPGDATLDLLVGSANTPLSVAIPGGTDPATAVRDALRAAGISELGRATITGDGRLEATSTDGTDAFPITVSDATGGMVATAERIGVRDAPPVSDDENFDYFHGLGGETGRAAAIAPGTVLKYGVTADAPAFERLLRSLRMAETTRTSPTLDRAAVEKALGLMNDALDELGQMRATVGARAKAVEDAGAAHDLATVYVQNMVDQTESLDLGEAMTQLSQQQMQLQAAYMILARLSSLTLLNYLK